MKTQRVLFIAYHYPPENTIGAARPYRFARYLSQLGYECQVITAADATNRPELNATYVPDPFLHAPGRGAGFQVERAVRKLLLPGAIGTQWAGAVCRAGMDYINRHAADPITIFSTFPPFGVHLAGYLLARKTGRPWIADFRDPMAHNPINNRLGTHTRALYRYLEGRIVSSASAVLANTDSAEALLKRNHPDAAGKIHLLWNGFDPEQRVSALPLPDRAFRVFTHTGELYEGRTVAPLLRGLKRLFDSGRMSPGSVRIELIGPLEPHCLPEPAFVQAAQTTGWLSITPHQVPKAEAQLAAQTSDGVLIVQPQSAVQVPGKIFDMLQIGRPILAFVPPESAIERLLSKAGVPYRCLYPSTEADPFDRALLAFLKLPATAVTPSRWFEQTFNAKNQTASLATVIQSIQRS